MSSNIYPPLKQETEAMTPTDEKVLVAHSDKLDDISKNWKELSNSIREAFQQIQNERIFL